MILFIAVFLGLAIYLVSRWLPTESETSAAARARAEATLRSDRASRAHVSAAISELVRSVDIGAPENAILLFRLAGLLAQGAPAASSAPDAPPRPTLTRPTPTSIDW